MGNHYVKVYCLIANFLCLLVFVANGLFVILLFFSLEKVVFWAFWQCCDGKDSVFHRYWQCFGFSKLAYIINSVANPSISKIIPNKQALYLGNAAAAAASPNLLLADEWNLTHVLELWSDEKQKNDPAHVNAVLLVQLQASDAPGSDLNMMTIACSSSSRVLWITKPWRIKMMATEKNLWLGLCGLSGKRDLLLILVVTICLPLLNSIRIILARRRCIKTREQDEASRIGCIEMRYCHSSARRRVNWDTLLTFKCQASKQMDA